ncbi:hypothetical protein BCR33DRAFT_837270 [Rhizoclosmatium globosum]|uniref:Uncharacterized protein n=1 Tax=Rhizoclosmatium globosum TaxID=329046 RepID=A0A1Y2CVL3_9FUNG|nr:hypothetical protein BCR33DRAFT_837270 [Rhizoclosmatium globosum]|eukprot:ORY51099.1 hypothetical protein BCR33DRAFT_837270 [Rhizoclosmatium globosum]
MPMSQMDDSATTSILPSPGITLLPRELIQSIIELLPITTDLTQVGWASKTIFAPTIFCDSSFAKNHFLSQYSKFGKESAIDFVFNFIERDNDSSGLDLLPLTYQTAICQELVYCKESAGKLRYVHLHLFMSPRRFNLHSLHMGPPNESLLIKIVDALIKDPAFDLEYYSLEFFRWFSSYGVMKIIEMIFDDGRIIPENYMYRTPHGCIIEYLIKDGRAQPHKKDIIYAAKNGFYTAVEAFMKHPGIDSSPFYNDALQFVCRNLFKHEDVDTPWYVSWEESALHLLTDPRVDPSINYNELLYRAIIIGLTRIVTVILKDSRVDPSLDGNKALLSVGSRATQTDQENAFMYESLLADLRVDPSVDGNSALMLMAVRGCSESVQVLLKDPRLVVSADEAGTILAGAAGKGNVNVVKILLEDGRFPFTIQTEFDAEQDVLEVFSAHRKTEQLNLHFI